MIRTRDGRTGKRIKRSRMELQLMQQFRATYLKDADTASTLALEAQDAGFFERIPEDDEWKLRRAVTLHNAFIRKLELLGVFDDWNCFDAFKRLIDLSTELDFLPHQDVGDTGDPVADKELERVRLVERMRAAEREDRHAGEGAREAPGEGQGAGIAG